MDIVNKLDQIYDEVLLELPNLSGHNIRRANFILTELIKIRQTVDIINSNDNKGVDVEQVNEGTI